MCSRWLCGVCGCGCVHGTVCRGFGGVSVQQVTLWCVCVGQFVEGLGE